MCGIAGEVRFDGPPNAEAVQRMTGALVHRGPDGEGFYSDAAAALGHRRLSILDLVGGSQPMIRQGCAIVFNGEAYEFEELRQILVQRGHEFRTRSDTEVVLEAYLEWGDHFVERVHGMFALALWDSRRRRLVLARDRMGKKPLYYALAGPGTWCRELASERQPVLGVQRLIFGSELKALIAHGGVPLQLDGEGLVQYLACEYVPAPLSIFDAVRKLPAAHLAVLDERGFRLRRYWDLPNPEGAARSARSRRPRAEVERELVELLDRAVARRLVADVPVGVFLSGGIDSTSVAALAARHKSPLETFSIGFAEASFDESNFARLAAQRLGTNHHIEYLSSDACLEEIPKAVENLDEPFADPSFLPTLLLSRFVRRRVTVALAGDGGDELFAGYAPFLAHRPAQLMARMPSVLRRVLRAAVGRLRSSAEYMSLDFRLKQFLKGLDAPPQLRHQVWIGSFQSDELAELLPPDLRPLSAESVIYREVLAEAERGERAGIQPGSIDEALRFYLTRYLTDDILTKVDRASMAASLEVRAPFLDTPVVEFAAQLPWQEKLNLTNTKLLLRRAFRELVPEQILHRPKQGFAIPIAGWIRGPLRDLFEDLFSPASLAKAGVFEPKPTRALLERHLSGSADLRKPLWTLAMFLLWQRRWMSAQPAAGPRHDRPFVQKSEATANPISA
jgi:asparagine synthase (glutamine-hydrolysing)